MEGSETMSVKERKGLRWTTLFDAWAGTRLIVWSFRALTVSLTVYWPCSPNCVGWTWMVMGSGEKYLIVCWWLLQLDLPVGVVVTRPMMILFMSRFAHVLIYCRRHRRCRRMLRCILV